jgi:signal transduction histidine kinase/ActR/RegA family two-component response regulator
VLAAIPSINAGASVSARDLTPAGFNSHEIGVKQPEKSGNQTPPATKHETSGGSNSVDKNATPEKSNKAQDPAETSSSSIENNESGDGRKASVHPAQSRIPLNSARPSTVLSSERDNSLRKLIKNAGKLFSPSAAINNATENIRRFPEFTLIFGFIIGALMTISLVLARAALARAKELETLNKQLAALNQELSAARDQALEGSRLKSEFVANISHELRTPLSAVIGMNSLLLNTKLDEKQKQYAALAKDSAQSLLGIINDILDFSKIEAGRLEIQTVKFSLNSVLKEVCDVLAPVVQAKGLTLAAVADPELGDESISADPTRLRQILLNLTGNAAKFTSSGQILIRVAKTLDERGVPRARFSVIDTGIGISNEAQTRLFRPFVQADGSTTRRFGGTGLGLSISKHLVELMGGQISVESTEGKGSTFSFDLPFLPNAENKSTAAEPLAERPSLSELTPAELGPVSCSVLVAEDSLVLQVMVRQLLEKLGCEVEIVSNGKEAIAALSNKSYNLVLMDWQMPEMDGLEATRLIRTMEKQTGKHVPIIAMTANAMQGDKNRCLEAGMNGYLSKPFKIEDLKSIIKEYTNPPVQQKPES